MHQGRGVITASIKNVIARIMIGVDAVSKRKAENGSTLVKSKLTPVINNSTILANIFSRRVDRNVLHLGEIFIWLDQILPNKSCAAPYGQRCAQ